MKTRHFHFSWAATYAFTKFYLFRHWRCNEKIFRNLSGPGFPGCTSRALNDCTSPNNSKIISKEQMSFYGANRKRRLSRSANDVSKFPESSRPPIKFSFVLVVLPPPSTRFPFSFTLHRNVDIYASTNLLLADWRKFCISVNRFLKFFFCFFCPNNSLSQGLYY